MGLSFLKSLKKILIVFFPRYRYVNHAHVRPVRTEPKGARFVHYCCSGYLACGMCESYFQWETVPIQHSIADTVGDAGWKRRKTSGGANTYRLRCKCAPRQVSTFAITSGPYNSNSSPPPSELYASRASIELHSLARCIHLDSHRHGSSVGWIACL